jgi:hypothetical protein
MMSSLKKVAMIMLVGLLIAGPIVPPHAVAQSDTGAWDRTMGAAQAAQDKASKAYNSMMMNMKSMAGMPMTANEKAMMKQMDMMAQAIKDLMESNHQLMELLKIQHSMPTK